MILLHAFMNLLIRQSPLLQMTLNFTCHSHSQQMAAFLPTLGPTFLKLLFQTFPTGPYQGLIKRGCITDTISCNSMVSRRVLQPMAGKYV
jgi:hypothetical protein